MTPQIAVALLTCDRPEFTARTVSTFLAQNDPDRFLLLHGDDASTTDAPELARQAGFETVIASSKRQGIRVMRTALIEIAAARADWVLFLENDIVSLREFPWSLFDLSRRTRGVDCLRLYGKFKDAHQRERCLTTHKRMGHRPVTWLPFWCPNEPAEIAAIHWSAQPSVTRSPAIAALHRTGVEPAGQTVRVQRNVMAHIGLQAHTPGGRS